MFAAENPDVNVLNYAPGIVETEMWNTLLTKVEHPDTKAAMEAIVADGLVRTTKQTVEYLIQLLKSQEYKSAEFVEYYAIPQV